MRAGLDNAADILKRRFMAVSAVLLAATLVGTIGFRLVEGWPFENL